MTKNLKYYLSLPYKLEIIPDTEEGGFCASYPELPGCVTCAETMEQVIANALDAKKNWLSSPERRSRHTTSSKRKKP